MNILSPTSLFCMGFVFIIWLSNELIVEFRNQSDSTTVSNKAKQNNFYLVSGTALCFVVFGVLLTANLTGSRFGTFPSSTFSYLGSFIALSGIALRRYAIYTLKDNFDGLIQIKETQNLTTNGLYAFVRHPSYTGSILFFIGFGMSSLNVVTFVLFTSFIFTIYYFRIQYEEEVLINAFGAQYLNYKRNTSPFFPNYKTIKKLGVKRHVQKSRNTL